MKRLLLQSDDYGITHGVSAGILRVIQDGVIRNTGMFVNMESSKEAADLIKDRDVCLGIDINYVAGKPITDPKKVPHLVDENGYFHTSRRILETQKLEGMEGIIYHFSVDPFPYEEILLETENQVKEFKRLTGKMPEYLHPHSICTPNTERAACEIAKKYHIFHTTDMMKEESFKCLPGAISMKKGASVEEQLQQNVEEEFLTLSLPSLLENETGYYIFHCGYIDQELMRVSSLNLKRMLDLEAAVSSKVKDYIQEHQIELITYREIKEEKCFDK